MESRVWHKQYDEGVPIDIDFEDVTIPEFLDRTAQKFGHRPAMFFMNKEISYKEFGQHVNDMAVSLQGLGVKEGSRVAIQMPNMPPTVIAYYAAMKLGAEVVLTNPLYTPREIEHQWNDADCEFAFVADFIFDQTISGMRDKVGIKHYIIAGIADYLGFPLNFLAPIKLKKQSPPLTAKVPESNTVHDFRKLIKRASGSVATVKRDMESVAVLQYTGGTTGVSKGATLTHRNLSCNIQQIDNWFVGNEHGNEVILTALPIFHVFGMTACMNWSVYSGAAMAIVPNPRDFKALVGVTVKRKVTLFLAVPAIFNALNHYPDIENHDLSSVKFCFSGSAPLPIDTMEQFTKRTASVIVEGFGMSETSPGTHVSPLGGTFKPGSVGIPVSNTDSRIVGIDDPTVEMPVGEEGELVVRGPQVMRGYWNRPDATAEVMTEDGFFKTGDVAVIQDDGYYRIVDRIKDMILVSGFNVYPNEIEDVISGMDGVVEVGVVGVKGDDGNESVKAFVVLEEGASVSEDAIKAYAKENLAGYKCPREVAFIDELPKSAVGKILRRELR